MRNGTSDYWVCDIWYLDLDTCIIFRTIQKYTLHNSVRNEDYNIISTWDMIASKSETKNKCMITAIMFKT